MFFEAGIWAYQRHRQNGSVHTMALNLVRGVPLTVKEKQAMIDILTPFRRRDGVGGTRCNLAFQHKDRVLIFQAFCKAIYMYAYR